MGVNSLPKTVTRQRRDSDLNPGPSAPESSMLTTRLPSHLAQALRSVIASFLAPESTIKNLSTAYSPMQNRHSNLPGNEIEKDRDEEERNGREGQGEKGRGTDGKGDDRAHFLYNAK